MSELREPSTDRDDALVTVASLYYELNQNQQQIADRLEISRSSVSRMIKEARDRGIVTIKINKAVVRDYTLEQSLLETFGLRDALVLLTNPGMSDEKILQGVGRIAALHLEQILNGLPAGASIGIAWGTGVHAVVSALPDNHARQIDVVQILGSIGSADHLIDGPELARLMASKVGGRHYEIHAPGLLAQPELRDMLLEEPAVRSALQRARAVALAITGIGTVQPEAASFLRAGYLSEKDLAALRAQGVVGETVGRFFDIDGNTDAFAINQRIMGIELDALRHIPRVVAVARGLPKAQSILGALRGKYMTVLATDDVTARAVLQEASATQEAI